LITGTGRSGRPRGIRQSRSKMSSLHANKE
jgi:hypothetical protein